MKPTFVESYGISALTIILGALTVAPANSQPITPANDGTGTTVNQNANQFNIEGGRRNGANLFHSFDKFNVNSGQTANFVTTPDTSNILGRVTGGNASYINGLIQVLGSNSNLFLMNPAGIMFGPNASLNIPASFSVTTATGIGFDNNNYWFKAMGTNDYANLVGNPSGYRFNVSNPGAIVNEGNLTLNPGENLTLLGGTVINTGELSTPGGNITVAAVEGGNTLRISQPGHLLSLEVNSTTANGEDISGITPLSLAALLTGGEETQATSVIVNANGEIVLTDSNTLVADSPGDATISGKIDVSSTSVSQEEGGVGSGSQANVLGSRVALVDTTINADGLNGGGTVLIGGESQESNTVFNSQQTSVNSGSIISANAIEDGDGGNVTIWSDGTTNFAGNISAKGGEFSGNGGFVEVTGKQDLTFDGTVDVTAALGEEGTIFSQPESVTIGESENSDTSQIVEDNTEVETTENSEIADGSETTETEALEDNTEVETTENSEVADGSETTETEATIDPFAQDENSDVTISAENIGQLSGNVILEADNDITVNEKIETDSSVELKAGRSININADIDTSVGNGNIDLLGNNDKMNVANRSEGAASINQLDGTTLNAGSGTINIELGNLGEVGDINLENLTTTGEVLVNANGGNIARVSENSLINAGSVLFQTSGNGGIGLTDAPLRFNVENLEAVSGSGGVFFDVGNVNIGGVSEDVDGISTDGGDIDINSDGDVTLTESLSTQEIVENNSEAEISAPSGAGGSEAVEATENTEITNTNGSINIEATGDIVATGSGIKGGGESVSLSATNITINDEFDETSGDADVKLSATNDITVEDIEDDVLEFLPGDGEIEFRADVDGDGVGVVEMLDNEADVGSNPDTFENGADTIKTNGRNLTIAGAEIVLGNIDTSWLPVYSGGELATIDVDEGGAILDEDFTTFTFTVDGDLGTVEDLDVRFSASHTWNSDIEVYLTSPEGQEVTLFAGVGGSGENFQDTVLDDDASIGINSGNAPFDGTYSPQGSLADFNGENPNGSWTLRVRDTVSDVSFNAPGGVFSIVNNGILYRAGDTAPWGSAIGTQLLLRNPTTIVSGGGNSGGINLEATHSDIRVGNIRSLSESADGGRVNLKANNNIITGLINSSSIQGIGGDVNLNTISGNIRTYSLDSNGLVGGGNTTITAGSNMTIASVNSSSSDGDAGAIVLDAGGDITTASLSSSSNSSNGNSGNGGAIVLDAGGDITTASLNSSNRDSGNGGAISLEARGNITTESLNSSSLNFSNRDSGNGGAISLEAGANITTESLSSFSSSLFGNSGNGGAISLEAGANITTESLSSFSNSYQGNSGNGGTISLEAGGDITTASFSSYSLSQGNSGNGGAISLEAGDAIITGNLSSYSLSQGNSGNGGDISLEAGGNIVTRDLNSSSSSLSGQSGNGGAISLEAGGDITTGFLNSYSSSLSGQSGNGGAMSLEAGGNIITGNLSSNSQSLSGQSGNGGVISLSADTIKFNSLKYGDTRQLEITTFSVGTNDSRNGGKVNITTNNLSNAEILTLSTHSKSGDVTIESQPQGNLQLNDLSIITTKQVTVEAQQSPAANIYIAPIQIDVGATQGQSGPVSIISNGNLNLNNVRIESDTKSDNPAGNVNIYSLGNITLDNTDILSTTNGQGDAGTITLETSQDIQLTNNSQLQASTQGRENAGNAGTINILANNLNLNQDTSLITETTGAGNPGSISIQAPTVDIGEGAQISATVVIGSTSDGDGGNITINTNELNITGRLGIFAETEATANAGTLTLSPYKNNPDIDINFSNDGFISASTSSEGNGGNIFISAPENIDISGEGFIAVETSGTGNAGIIDIQTENLRISDGVAISASTEDKGNAGEININTTDFTLEKGTSLTTETNSAGKAGDIEITTQQLTIGEDAQISATAREKATNTEAGGNITINANELEITGKLGIFAETAGESPAGTLTLNPYKVGTLHATSLREEIGEFDPNLNITFKEKGFISARTTSIGDGGNINIFAPENINILGEGFISVEATDSGDAGTINIETQNLTIAENTTISASTSNSGKGGTININPSQTFQLEGQILTETKGRGDGGTININTGEMTAPNSTISAKSTDAGNAGEINIEVENNITTGIITSEASSNTQTADGGNISISSQQGEINATQTIQSFSDGANAGNVTLQAKTDITTNTISSHGQQQGGEITITSETGNIDTSNGDFLANYSGGGNAGDVNLEAPQGNITTNNLYSFADGDGGKITLQAGGDINLIENSNIISASEPPEEQGSGGAGKGGDIIIKARNNINTATARIFSGADEGDTGKIDITADGVIETGSLDLASGFVRQRQEFNNNNNFTLIPQPQGTATQGTAGNITLKSNNSNIDTTGGTINSRSPDGTGNITLNARGNITTGTLQASALNESKPTTGGNVEIISQEGEITATQQIETFSEKGKAGNVNLTAAGHIHTDKILSQGTQKGGNITINSRSENSIDAAGALNTYSEEGTAGDVNLTSPGSINISSIRSEGMEQGGNITVNSEIGEINSTGDIDSYSNQGIGGNVEVNAPESVTLANVSSFGMTESGNLIIQSSQAQVETGNVETQADGPSGNIIINGTQITTGNLSSLGTTSAGILQLEATDGSITTRNLNSIASEGEARGIEIDATEDVTTENQTVISGDGDAQINTNIGGSLNAETQTVEATNGNAEINNQVDGNLDVGSQTVQATNGNATVENTAEQINIGTQTVQVNNGNATVENTAEQINIGTQTVQVNNGNATVENTGEQINIGTQTVQAINGTETIINTNADTSNTVTAEIPTQNNLPNTNNFIPTNESLNLQNEGTNQNTNNTTNSQETNTLSTTTTSDIISTATPSNNNQTANTTTAQSQTESSINNTTDTQQILKIIDTPNTNPLTVATDSNQVVMMLEENRLKEFSNYFGEDLAEQLVNTKSVRDILTDMAKQTGKESAVVYIKAYPEQLQLILYTKSGQPIIKTIADAKHKQLKRLVKKLRHEIINSETDSYLTPAQQLYDWLIAPISAELEAANINTLLFSMDEGLRTLPVAVLHDGSQFLIEKYSLSLIPSVSLMDTNYRPLQDTQVLAMGASKFTSESPLPAVPIELETISQNLWQGSKFINEEFTRNNLLNQRKNYPYPIIHLATHAEFLPGSANTSYIHLWGDDKIRLDEIRELGWSQPAVDLLVLSACKTAFGDKNAELGFAGFAVAAGVKSALASIWYVSDEGTLGLMTEFYTHLNNAKIKVEALRQAQLAMLRGEVVIADGELRGSGTRGAVVLPSALGDVENNNLSHPYYWAGFTMIGSPW